MHFSAIYRLRW